MDTTKRVTTTAWPSQFMMVSKRWTIVVLYAVAMAWVEAAAVVYLRTLVGRLDPYQADPLPKFGDLAPTEVIRELSTLIMLGTVGWLAGGTPRARFGYSLVAFGVWDIFYYIFLKVMCGWPKTLWDWDILFLIPLPWWGPVWAPMAIAALMVLGGTLVSQFDTETRRVWPGFRASLLGAGGAMLALFVFMIDALAALEGGLAAVAQVLPIQFPWPLFLIALVLMSCLVLDMAVNCRQHKWLDRKEI